MLLARSLIVASLGLTQFGLLVAQKHTTRPSAQQSAADRAWPEFFTAFRTAVQKRDRAALKQMMVPDFYFSAGGGDDNQDGDSRDEAFQYWGDPGLHGWQAFAGTLAKGTAPTAQWWGSKDENGKEHPSRIAPPAANIKRNSSGPHPKIGWLCFFEFRDGHWYCTSFSECCD